MTVRKPLTIAGAQVRQLQAAETLQASAATTANASLNAPHGTAPTFPFDGDIWTTSSGAYVRINGVTVGPLSAGGGSGDVVGPGSATDSDFAQFDTTTGKLIKDGGLSRDTDGTLAANSDSKIPSQKAVKTYVDGKVAGLSWKQAVRAATTANGTLASAFENGDTIDGVTLATGDRILIKNQSSAADNGIYTVNASGAPTRSTDADSGAELVNATCYVSEGTANADTQWTCTTNATITVGSTSLAFAQLSSGGYSDEQAQDAVGAMVDASLVYVDATPLLTRAALTGDVTAPQGSNATTLAASGAAAGTYGDGTHTSQVTVDAKGRVTSIASVAITGGGGGGGGSWTNPDIAPPLSSWFTTTANTPVLADYADYGMGITGAAGGTIVRYAVKAGLAGDTTIITRILANSIDANTSAGIVIRDSSGGRLITVGIDCVTNARTGFNIDNTQWSSASVTAGNGITPIQIFAGPIWLKVVYTLSGKKVDSFISYDGKIWHQTMTANTYVTNPDSFGVYVWSTGTGGTGGVPAAVFTYWTDGTNNGTPLVLLKG
jgi:hypothetical protein